MIRRPERDDVKALTSLIYEHRMKNPYLYMDTVTFGLFGDNFETFTVEQDGKTVGAIYRYYDSLQPCLFDGMAELDEIAEFINSGDYSMASATADVIGRLAEKVKGYSAHFGVIMSAEIEGASPSGKTELATSEDCREIAELICTDREIGGHYSVNGLERQLRERMTDWGCVNLVLRVDGKIACHMATYAVCKGMAALGGLITAPEHRGHGYGRVVLSDLALRVMSDGCTPVQYCYTPATVRWYESLGCKVITECGKLEKIK